MIGVNRHTGQELSGDAHLAQSIRDILTTPIATRVMRRGYGSRVPELLDEPLNGTTVVACYGAIAEALDRWEPRVKLDRIVLLSAAEGRVEAELQGTYTDRSQDQGVVLQGADVSDAWAMQITLAGVA